MQELHFAAQLGDVSNRGGDFFLDVAVVRCGFYLEQHLIIGHLTAHHEAGARDFWEALDDFGDLTRMYKHAANLGGLIGATHPAFDARIRAPCWAIA